MQGSPVRESGGYLFDRCAHESFVDYWLVGLVGSLNFHRDNETKHVEGVCDVRKELKKEVFGCHI